VEDPKTESDVRADRDPKSKLREVEFEFEEEDDDLGG